MNEIASADGRLVVLEEIATPNNLVVPFAGEPYVALLWACDDSLDANQRHEVVTALIQSGCRYLVCGGINCEAWHDDADMAWAILDTESAPGQETPHVMTTWHTDEPEQEVVFFAFNLTNFDEHDFRKYLVLTIGHDSVVRNRLEKLIRSTLIPS